MDKTKEMVQNYFGTIPRGKDIERVSKKSKIQLKKRLTAKAYDSNIQIPAVIAAYRTPSFKERDSRVLDMISTYLSDGPSSKLYKKLVDEKKMALQQEPLTFLKKTTACMWYLVFHKVSFN
jgi:zinc protease